MSIFKESLYFDAPQHPSGEFDTLRSLQATWESQWILHQWLPRFAFLSGITYEFHRLPATKNMNKQNS